ncbi:hypothetical protein LTS15_011285 [Exophiala xenobiotica]|nr:hypothetical protein LTS15_011285 [Exophiala xenobiotica]
MQSSNDLSDSVQDHGQYAVKESLDTSSIALGHAEQEIHLPEQHGVSVSDAPPVNWKHVLPTWMAVQLQHPPNAVHFIGSLKKRGLDAESFFPFAKRRETAENPALEGAAENPAVERAAENPAVEHAAENPGVERAAENPAVERAAEWVHELPGQADWDRELPDTEYMSSSSSDTLLTDPAHRGVFLKPGNIHDLDPNLKPRAFDDLQRYLAQECGVSEFCECELEDRFISWHRYANTHTGEASLKAMHHALLPGASMDLPPPHRWDTGLTWEAFVKPDGSSYTPDYFVGLDPKTLTSHFSDDPELSAYFQPHKDGAVYPHMVAEFKSSFGENNHAMADIIYGGAICATTSMLLRRNLVGYQSCFDVPIATSYTVTPAGFRCYVHFCRMVDDDIHYYLAKILDLTMGASFMEFKRNLRQFWRFLRFGQSLRESDHQRGLFREVRPEAALTLDAWLNGNH